MVSFVLPIYILFLRSQLFSCRYGCVCASLTGRPAICHLCGLVGRAVCVCLPDRRSASCAVL